MNPRSEKLKAEYGLEVDRSETQVLLYDHVTGTTVGMPLDAAEILLDELRWHVANARLNELDEES